MGYRVVPVAEGDVEEPVFVTEVSPDKPPS
jgi:hypothetical protein